MGASLFYRIYPLGPDGRLQPPIELESLSDETMLERLAEMGLPFLQRYEVWALKRLVGRFQIAADGQLERRD